MMMQEYERVWEKMEHRLMKVLRRHHPDYQDDLLVETKLAVWTAVQSYDPSRGATLETHVYNTVIWANLKWLRDHRYLIRIPVHEQEKGRAPLEIVTLDRLLPRDEDDDQEDYVHPALACDVDFEACMTRKDVRAAIEDLKPDYRDAVQKIYYEGMSTREAARAAGVGDSTMVYRRRQAEKFLRVSLWRYEG